MSTSSSNPIMQQGQRVKVIEGTKDPDFGNEIGGWTGVIIEPPYQGDAGIWFYTIRWDSVTLRNMDKKLRKRCEAEGLDDELMVLVQHEVISI